MLKNSILRLVEDLASECRDELEVLRKLLPEPVTASEIYEELRYWAEKNHYLNEEIASEIQIPKKEMGVVIKYIKSKLPTADGKMISEIVKEKKTLNNNVQYYLLEGKKVRY